MSRSQKSNGTFRLQSNFVYEYINTVEQWAHIPLLSPQNWKWITTITKAVLRHFLNFFSRIWKIARISKCIHLQNIFKCSFHFLFTFKSFYVHGHKLARNFSSPVYLLDPFFFFFVLFFIFFWRVFNLYNCSFRAKADLKKETDPFKKKVFSQIKGSNHLKVFCITAVLENFGKFIGAHLWQSLFL